MFKKKKQDETEILEFDDEKKLSKIDNIKLFLSDKRNKAIVKLAIYGIFLLIVIIYIRLMNSSNRSRPITPNNYNLPSQITEKVKLLNQDNDYIFTINYDIINENEYLYSFNGEYKNNNMLVYLNDTTYYYDENGFYEIIDGNKEYIENTFLRDLHFYFPNMIYKYLIESEYQYKKEDLNSNVTINSLLKVSEFNYLNHNLVDSDSKIVIETTENSRDNVINISIDMTNYYNMLDANITKYIINLQIKY